MEPLFSTSINHVQFAVQRLKRAALEPIPSLDEVAPKWPKSGRWSESRYRAWAGPALARTKEAIAWRDKIRRLMGSTEAKNQYAPDPEWDHARLSKELGYYLSRSEKDANGQVVRDAAGRVMSEPDPDWGPPETLLGEFYRDEELEADRKRRGDDKQQWQDYLPGSHPVLYLGDARTYLGNVPNHLSAPMPFALLTGRIGRGKDEYDLMPQDWWEYSDTILQQCLLVRARALELCAWCEGRLSAIRTAVYPIIRIGPVMKGKRNRRQLRVEAAGQPVKLESDSIPYTLADYLLKVRGGRVAVFNRKYASELIGLIPPLSGLLRPVASTRSAPKSGRNDARYTLDEGVVVFDFDDAAQS